MSLGAKVFKTSEGASKHARFNTNHCEGRFVYVAVRCWGPANEPDNQPFDPKKFERGEYRWRIDRRTRVQRA